ncbi:hypothetical protein [Baekduia sp.]|jgi:trigger factor|uniref:hypothetical protein n=1 Tax=Baekduia sp. TaxID=2600305 RepID=UPI002DF9DB8C|nr:hypothetical protein [Baekduia sp.]
MSEAAPTSRNIPLPIQREVRQRCGFGCVICGLPLYEYEHLLGWANVHRHVAEEITLLCDQHHRERTGGLLPIETVQNANNDPCNLREGVSKPYDLHYSGDECEVRMGSLTFTTSDAGYGTIMVPISVDDTPLVGFILSEGHLLLNVNLFDEFNNCILRVVNNQLVQSAEPWDIQLTGRNLVIRAGHRDILVDLTFEPPNRVLINRGRLLRNGVEIVIRPSYVLVVNNRALIQDLTVINCAYGLKLGPHRGPGGAAVAMDGINRYPEDSSDAMKWAESKLSKDVPEQALGGIVSPGPAEGSTEATEQMR